jgi:hypothetical protein
MIDLKLAFAGAHMVGLAPLVLANLATVCMNYTVLSVAM